MAETVLRPLHVLVVDFAAITRAMLKQVIQASGVPIARVLEAENGREALAILHAEAVDVLFTTISLPEMSGTDLLRQVNERPEWDRILRVVVAADGSTAWRVEMSTLKVRCYVEKPFRPDVVRDVLCVLIP